MSKNVLLILMLFVCALFAACTSDAPNANTNSNAVTNINPANLPPGFSTSPVPPSSNTTPGIPDPATINANNVPKGGTPTPGIPDPKNIGKPLPKGATPTPGIPDPNELKQKNPPLGGNANGAVKPSTATDSNAKVPTVRKP